LELHRTVIALSHTLSSTGISRDSNSDDELAEGPMAVIELRDAVNQYTQVVKTSLTPMLAAFYQMNSSVVVTWHVIYKALLKGDTKLGRWC
jgi:hypothetical protein